LLLRRELVRRVASRGTRLGHRTESVRSRLSFVCAFSNRSSAVRQQRSVHDAVAGGDNAYRFSSGDYLRCSFLSWRLDSWTGRCSHFMLDVSRMRGGQIRAQPYCGIVLSQLDSQTARLSDALLLHHGLKFATQATVKPPFALCVIIASARGTSLRRLNLTAYPPSSRAQPRSAVSRFKKRVGQFRATLDRLEHF